MRRLNKSIQDSISRSLSTVVPIHTCSAQQETTKFSSMTWCTMCCVAPRASLDNLRFVSFPQWVDELSRFDLGNTTSKLSNEEILRHKLLLIAKALHEGQHEVTAQFLLLPRVAQKRAAKVSSAAVDAGTREVGKAKSQSGENKVIIGEGPAMSTRSKSVSPDFERSRSTKKARTTGTTTPSPPSSRKEAGGSQQNTPENVGSTMENGLRRGDSGHALEEIIFGGRLRHRHLIKKGPFQEQNIYF